MVKPIVNVNNTAFRVVAGLIPPLTELRKNCLTTPSGKIIPIISPRADPTNIPNTSTNKINPKDFFLDDLMDTIPFSFA